MIQEGFRRLVQYYYDSREFIQGLSEWFNLCMPLKVYKDIPFIINYMEVAYGYLALINYPYQTSFLKNVTAWLANSSRCSQS